MTPDIAAVAQAMTSLRVAGDIAKALVGIRDGQLLQAKVIELQAEILSAQQSAFSANTAQTALLERVRDLEKQVAQFEEWNADKIKYELTEVSPGCFAYQIKEEARGSEPSHLICANCYQASKKRVLQRCDAVHATCPECASKLNIGHKPGTKPASWSPAPSWRVV